MEDKIIKKFSFWRSVWIRFVKIILFLTAGNTVLRGNENSKTKTNNLEGNFIKTVKLMADFYLVLTNPLNNESHKTKYLGWKIQHELILIYFPQKY